VGLFQYSLGASSSGGVGTGQIDSGELAFGSGMGGSSSGLGVLHPLHPFGMTVWGGFACVVGLVVVFRSLH
jgi:hypothetical protein